jgi:hypothetical protein
MDIIFVVSHTDSAEDLEVILDFKLHFHNHAYTFYRCNTLIGLVRSVTFFFSSLKYTHILYFIFVISKHKRAFIVWNCIMSTNSIQQEFGALFLHVCFLRPITFTPML